MADSLMDELLGQFRELLGLVDRAAVSATRVQDSAGQARSAFAEASQGTNDRLMRQAVTNSQTATEKAGKTARLLAEASEHFATYLNLIAPGTVAPHAPALEATPSGEQLVSEAMQKALDFLELTSTKADDINDAVNNATKYVVDGSTAAAHQLREASAPSSPPSVPSTSAGDASTGATATPHAALRPPPWTEVSANDAVAAVAVSVIGTALVGRAALNQIKRPKREKDSKGDQG